MPTTNLKQYEKLGPFEIKDFLAKVASKSAQESSITDALRTGKPLLDALKRSNLFDAHFLEMVAAAEEGGRVPEMMEHQAEYYHEESSRRMATLTKLLSLLIWLIYAGFMVYMIFQIASIYLGALGGI